MTDVGILVAFVNVGVVIGFGGYYLCC